MPSPRFVSVVVCSYNGSQYLAATLAALQAQTYPRQSYEIIVVDDGSTDATAEIARTSGVRLVQHETNLGLGAARNTGLAAARGSIIAYTDDDCLPDAEWLHYLVAPYQSPAVMATGGRTFAVREVTPTERYMDLSGYGNPAPVSIGERRSWAGRAIGYLREMMSPLHNSLSDNDPLRAIYTLNASYRLSLLRAIGGFDDTLRAAEDSDVSARLHAAYPDKLIVYAQNARVGHRHRRRLWPWVRQTFVRSQDAFVQIRKEHRVPPLPPSPVASVLVGFMAISYGPVISAVTFLVAPIAFYWWWQVREIGPVFDRIRLPYIQFFLDGATWLGYIVAFLHHDRPPEL